MIHSQTYKICSGIFLEDPSLKDTSSGYTSVAAGQRSLKISILFQVSVSLFLESKVSNVLNTSLVLSPTLGTAINKSIVCI